LELPKLYLPLWSAFSFWTLGQIWLVEIVIYPLFAKVGEAEHVGYHRFYSRGIPLPMILPGVASFLLPIPLAFFGPTVPTWMTVPISARDHRLLRPSSSKSRATRGWRRLAGTKPRSPNLSATSGRGRHRSALQSAVTVDKLKPRKYLTERLVPWAALSRTDGQSNHL
jgi:hypothetical protein